MTTFDGWETRLYGDAMALPAGQLSDNELMHYRTKGSRNGHRRYQNPDGSWTPLGLKERKEREGWGEKRERRREARAARKEARKAARSSRKAAVVEKLKKNDLSNLTDAELQSRINRLKMEKEYKELTRSPLYETGRKIVTSIIESKQKKLDQENKKTELFVREQEAKAKLISAKAARTTAKSDLWDNVVGGKGRMKAKAELLKSKRQNTIRGAIGGLVSKVVDKEGSRLVKDMNDSSPIMRGGRFVKKTLKGAKNAARDAYTGAKEGYKQGRREAQQEIDEKRRKKQQRAQYVQGIGTVT